MEVGQRYEILGHGFNLWPEEIVLSYASSYLQTETLPSFRVLELVEKTDSKLTFEVKVSHTFTNVNVWSYFGSPNETPREVLSYGTL